MKKKLSSGAQYLVAFLFTLISVAGWGQAFNLVTNITDLTTGEYLIVGDGGSNDGLMKNSISAGPIIDYSPITNPGATITTGYTSENIFAIEVTGTTIKTVTIY